MKLDELRDLLRLLDEHEIAEFELEEEGRRLRVRKGGEPAQAVTAPAATAPVPAAHSTPLTASGSAPAEPSPQAAEEEGLVLVKSPIVGTFYRAPDPAAPPFVNLGDRVRVGQALCIIEAMKLMNEIESEVAGEVVKLHRESGQPVQFGDALFSIRPER